MIPLQASKCIDNAEQMSDEWINLEAGSHHAAAAWDHCLMVIWHTRSWPGLDQDVEALKLMAKNRAHDVLTIMSRAAACLGVPEMWKVVAVSAMEAGVADWLSVKMGAYQMIEILPKQHPLLSISAELLDMARLDTTASKLTKRDLLALMADSTLALPITGRGFLGTLHHL